MNTVTHQELIELLEYNPDTGIFKWKTTGSGKLDTLIAGGTTHDGYRTIKINYKAYPEHILAWFYCFQEWPTSTIDHIDRDKSNNKLNNLKECSQRINLLNRPNPSEYGNNIYKHGKKFKVKFNINYIYIHIGTYSLEDAIKVRDHTQELIEQGTTKFNIDQIHSDLNIEYRRRKC